MADLIHVIRIIWPVYALVLTGWGLKSVGIICPVFVSAGSKILFYFNLPILILIKLVEGDIKNVFNLKILILFYGLTFLIFFMALIIFSRFEEGPAVQASYRSNIAFISIPILLNIVPARNVAQALILLCLAMPIYNTLSVIALTRGRHENIKQQMTHVIIEVIKNPLVIASIATVFFSIFQVKLSELFSVTANFIGNITFPVALIFLGAFIRKISLKNISPLLISLALKNFILPVTGFLFAYLSGLDKFETVMLTIVLSAPTAVVSFILAEVYNNNSELAAACVVSSTAFSAISIPLILFLFRMTGYL